MSKRGNGEGCIISDPRGNGKYIGRLQIGKNPNGKPKIKTFSGKTVTEVRKKMSSYKKEQANLASIQQADCLLAEGMELWLQTHKKPFLKPASYDRLVQTVEWNVIPYLGNDYVKTITSDEIQQMITILKNKGLSLSSIKKAKEALNGYFNQLIIERQLSYNPVTAVRLPPVSEFEMKQKKALTAEEMDLFTKTATSKYTGVDEYRYRYGFGAVFILFTGLRVGEALALQYRHIDFKNKTVTVEQNLVSVTDGSGGKHRSLVIQKTVKTASGMRIIPLCDKAFEAISKHRDLYYRGDDEDFIFTTDKDTHLSPHNLAKSVNAIYKAAGIEASGVHILRHSFASWLFDNCVDVKLISRLLGHSGVQITYDTYVHESIDQLRDAMKGL